MRISQLSAESGVPIPTIKFYLREGLLPHGEQISATRAEYDQSHLRRLRLIRALLDVGRLPVAAIRKIIEAVEDDQLSVHEMLGTAHYALSPAVEPAPDDPDWRAARAMVDTLIADLGWDRVRHDAPTRDELAQILITLHHLGMPAKLDDLVPYAKIAGELVKQYDMKTVPFHGPRDTAVETLVIYQVLCGRMFDVLRRIAQESESARILDVPDLPTDTDSTGDNSHVPGKQL